MIDLLEAPVPSLAKAVITPPTDMVAAWELERMKVSDREDLIQSARRARRTSSGMVLTSACRFSKSDSSSEERSRCR